MKNNYFFRRVLSAIVMLIVSSFMWAAEFEVNGIYYDYNEDGNSVRVTFNTSSGGDYSGDIVIPSTVAYKGKTYSVTVIGEWAFLGCSSLTSVTIPNSVTIIGDWAFYSSSLPSIVIPNSVTSIGAYAFRDCSSLTSIIIPNSVTLIGDGAFMNCSSLPSIEIPNSVTRIAQSAFSDCISLTSIEIPNSVTSMGDNVFDGCSSLTSVEIPNSITSIGDFVFADCSSLPSIEIPNSVTSIGIYAFWGCSSLTSVVISNSVTKIGEYTFLGCSSLASVTCYAEDVPYLSREVFSGVPQSEATLYVPASALEAYKSADQWKEFGTILPIDGDANGITSTTAEQDTDATYYTLDGVSVKTPTKKGIYIKNGKKILVK